MFHCNCFLIDSLELKKTFILGKHNTHSEIIKINKDTLPAISEILHKFYVICKCQQWNDSEWKLKIIIENFCKRKVSEYDNLDMNLHEKDLIKEIA